MLLQLTLRIDSPWVVSYLTSIDTIIVCVTTFEIFDMQFYYYYYIHLTAVSPGACCKTGRYN